MPENKQHADRDRDRQAAASAKAGAVAEPAREAHSIMDNPVQGPASVQTGDLAGAPNYDPTIAGPPVDLRGEDQGHGQAQGSSAPAASGGSAGEAGGGRTDPFGNPGNPIGDRGWDVPGPAEARPGAGQEGLTEDQKRAGERGKAAMDTLVPGAGAKEERR